MRPSIRLINPASTYLGRVVDAMSSGSNLVDPGRGCTDHPLAARMPRLATTWLPIPDAEAASVAERFSAFRDARGTIVTMHAVPGEHPEPCGRLIALVTFEPQRVSIAEAGPDRFDARWQCAGIAYRMHAGPTTLGAFMQTLMSATWS